MWIVFRIFEIRIINEYFLGIMTNNILILPVGGINLVHT